MNKTIQPERPMTFEECCQDIREQAKNLGNRCRTLAGCEELKAEEKANCVLAQHHFEDARMRIGKVLQYAGNGVSVFDK